jgi:DNA topoisomerase IA
MTDMVRRTVSLPPELENRIIALRKSDKYCRMTISEITRKLIETGLKSAERSVTK